MESIKAMTYDLCKSGDNRFGAAFYEQHILLNEKYAHRLADILNADKEILSLAAYLHDIAAISDFSTLSEHHLAGAEKAGKILRDKGYPEPVINKVKKCIETHSVPLALGEGSIEEVCFSNADAITQIVNPVYWLYYAFSVRSFSFDEGKRWYYERVTSHWNKLIEPAKDLIDAEYHTILGILLK